MNEEKNKTCFYRHYSGVVLILMMVVLIVLTAVMYRVGSAVNQWKHRQQYMINYQIARYACESGLKYALAAVSTLEPNYISRPNEPDFSDLFTMSDEEYKLMMQEWAQKLGAQIDVNNLNKNNFVGRFIDLSSLSETNGIGSLSGIDFNNPLADFNFPAGPNDINGVSTLNLQESGELFVHGPYGPPWPYVAKPVEIEFGDARITIEIIDENAKLPLIWGISSDEEVKNESKAAIVTFCEWMQMEPNDIEPLLVQLEAVKEIKPFSVNLKPVVTVTKQQVNPPPGGESKSSTDGRRERLQSRRAARRASRARTKTIRETRPDIGHILDFAKLMHSPMIDLETLAKPVNEDENRSESALKYISLWGTGQVNVNTAPRHVLEAAFAFGGDAVEIAEQIINLRKEKPFTDVGDLEKRLFSYSDSVKKCEPYITVQSTYFSVRVKATSGVAEVCATAGVKKEKGKFQKIGIIIE
jgi:hypothetical protein